MDPVNIVDCFVCKRRFSSSTSFHEHCCNSADHAYCDSCRRLFTSMKDLSQHLQTSSAHYEENMHSFGHCKGVSKDLAEWSQDHLQYLDDASWSCIVCQECGELLSKGETLDDHLALSGNHHWCFVCSRDFRSAKSLRNHFQQNVHSTHALHCPLCKKIFHCPSAVAMHLESGTCHDISRHEVTAAVHALEITPSISVNRRLSVGPEPISSNKIVYSASEQAFNGEAFECYLCHKTFKKLISLNTHLSSPAHDADEFKCPKCQRTFKVVSGLIQHIESETCGVAKFKQVEERARELTAQFTRLLEF